MKLPLLALSLSATLPLAAEITAVTHPEEKFPARATVVWSPLFQAAWDRLNGESGGKPVVRSWRSSTASSGCPRW
jgi:hypothetical protein